MPTWSYDIVTIFFHILRALFSDTLERKWNSADITIWAELRLGVSTELRLVKEILRFYYWNILKKTKLSFDDGVTELLFIYLL